MAGNLYIKYSSSDTGTRPIPANTPFWLSPSIWIGTPGNSTATVGTAADVYVQVDRIGGGSDTNLVEVQAWVCHSTTSPGPSGAVLSSAGGAGGMSGVISPGLNYPQIADEGSWTPLPGDVDDANTGLHSCIAVNAFEYGGNDGVQMTTGYIDPVNVQQQGQRNISIVPAAQPIKMISYPFRVPAGAQLGIHDPLQKSVVRVAGVQGHGALGDVVKEELLKSRLIHLHGGKPVPEVGMHRRMLREPLQRAMMRGGGELALARTPEHMPLFPAQRPVSDLRVFGEGGAGREIDITPRAGVILPMRVNFELPDERPGAVHEFDITQTRADGLVLGGIRVVVVRGLAWW